VWSNFNHNFFLTVTVLQTTLCLKNVPLSDFHISTTDFQPYFTSTLSGQLAIMQLLNIAPHINCVATSAGSSPQYLQREPITGVWEHSPQRGPGAEPLVRGANPPEAEAFLVFGRLMKAANLPSFLKFGNAKKSDICVIFAKHRGWPNIFRRYIINCQLNRFNFSIAQPQSVSE